MLRRISLVILCMLALSLILVGAFIVLRPQRKIDLPALQPVPSYLKVYPDPGQLLDASTKNNTTLDFLYWKLGRICVELEAANLLRPGDFWDGNDIEHLSSLIVDDQKLELLPTTTDGASQVVLFDGKMAVAKTGGPYGMCWEGPKAPGYHIATFAFGDQSYTWWYRLNE